MPDRSNHYARIQQLALWAEWVCNLALAFVLGITILSILSADLRDDLFFGDFQTSDSAFPFDAATRKAMFYLSIPPTICLMFAVYKARQLFRGYRNGDIFTESAGKRFETVGWAISAMPLLFLITKIGMVTYFANSHVGNGIKISISFGDFDFTALALGLLAVLVGRILGEAAKIADENKQFI